MRFEERLVERNRIARELHDTLLQGLLSATLYLDVTAGQLDQGSPMQASVRRVIEIMENLSEDARNAVRGLRTVDPESNTVEEALRELASQIDGAPATGFSVLARGEKRPLRPDVHEEVCGIGREAVINAWKHAEAQHITVRLQYCDVGLLLEVSDDGSGMDPATVCRGREGHWGLVGMRERAARLGAELQIRSEVGEGTSVSLRVPADLAFSVQNDD